MAWLAMLQKNGVVNMEMESLGFTCMCHRANIRGKLSHRTGFKIYLEANTL